MAAPRGTTIAPGLLKQRNQIKVEEEEPAGSESEEEMEEATGGTSEILLGGSSQCVKQEPEEQPPPKRRQEFQKPFRAPRTEVRQWTDCWIPAASEGLTQATEWTGGSWASQPQPMSISKAKQDHEVTCGGKEKKRVRDTNGPEMRRWRFRTQCYREAEGPRETCRQLQELCRQWLRPERYTKEQILDLLTLEQFLTVLPQEMQRWVRERDPENCSQAVTLAEDFLQAEQGAKGSEQQIKDSSEDTFVNLLKTSKELPRAAKKPRFTEAKQRVDGSTTLSAGDEGLSTTEEEPKPPLESPEEEEPQEMTSETAKEGSPGGRKGDKNPCRAESRNGNNTEMEVAGPALSEGVDQKSLHEATASQQGKSMKCEADKESSGPSPQLLTCERKQAGGEKAYKCCHCGQSFGSSLDLLSHERTHMGEKLYKCVYCGESERIRVGQKPHKCSQCGNTFAGNSEEGIHPDDKPHICSECGINFRRISELLKHQRTHTGEKPYKCAVCGESFANISGLKCHQKNYTGGKPYTCSHCGQRFCWSSDLTWHERIHTGEVCSSSGNSLSQNSDLIEHEETNMAEEAFTCFACGKAFDVGAELAAHIQTHKDPSFSQKQNVIIHENTRAGEKPYKCLVCGENFRNLTNLKSHERSHTEEKSHKCSHCDKSFRWISHLVAHERIHTGEKPYKCSDCGTSFAMIGKFLLHMRKMHPGQKSDTSSEGGIRSPSNSGLHHEKTHSREVPCMCSNCGRTFWQRSDQIDQPGGKGSKCPECFRS